MEEYVKHLPGKVEKFLKMNKYEKGQCEYICTEVSAVLENREDREEYIHKNIYERTGKYYKNLKKDTSEMLSRTILETLENIIRRTHPEQVNIDAIVNPRAALFILDGGDAYKNDRMKGYYESKGKTGNVRKDETALLNAYSDFVHVSKNTGHIYIGMRRDNQLIFFDTKDKSKDKKKKKR